MLDRRRISKTSPLCRQRIRAATKSNPRQFGGLLRWNQTSDPPAPRSRPECHDDRRCATRPVHNDDHTTRPHPARAIDRRPARPSPSRSCAASRASSPALRRASPPASPPHPRPPSRPPASSAVSSGPPPPRTWLLRLAVDLSLSLSLRSTIVCLLHGGSSLVNRYSQWDNIPHERNRHYFQLLGGHLPCVCRSADGFDWCRAAEGWR